MKILHVGKFYPPVPGGIETVLRNLAEGLAESGNQVTVLCSSVDAKGSEEIHKGVRVIRLPTYGKVLSQPLNPLLPFKLRKLASEFDLIHIHTPNPLSELSSILLSQNVPILVSYHSDIVRQKNLLSVYAPILRKFLKKAENIVVATENHITHSPFLAPLREKCEIIPYGIDQSEYEMSRDIQERVKDLSEQEGPYILFVGRLVGYKGLPTLLKAMPSIPAKLLIVGEGPLRKNLEALSRDLGIENKVKFLGKEKDPSQLSALYHACEMLVLPSISKNEAFGLVQIEAMACGKPLVTTRLESGISLVNENGVTGIQVEPGNPKALSEAILEILTDPQKKKRMGEAAKERFEKYYTRQKMVDSYRSLYSRILS